MTRLRLRPEDPFALATSIRFLEASHPPPTKANPTRHSISPFLSTTTGGPQRPVSAPLRRRGPRSFIAHLPGRRRAL